MDARSLAVRRVMKTVARRSLLKPLPVQASDGTRPVVVALPEDDLKSVIRRTEEFGNAANVFVPFPDSLALIEFYVDHSDAGAAADQEAHQNSSVAMYVEFLKLHNGPAKVQVSLSESASAPHGLEQLAYAF